MKNILIVEDSKVVNNIIAKELSDFGYKCHQAFDFKKAEVFLNVIQYNLIILDLHLPDGEGYDLIAKVKNLSDSKVVILTANTEQQLREELFQHGILDYIIKDKNLSFALKELHKILENLSNDAKKEKILVIDDSKFICKQIKLILGPRNYDITVAHTGQDGLNALSKTNFDLITLDIELPDMLGNEVLDKIKLNNRNNDIPVLVLSGTQDANLVRILYKQGASDFIKKPFVVEEFVLKVDLWIDYKRKHNEALNNRDKILSQQSKIATMSEIIENTIHQSKEPLSKITTLASGTSLKQEHNLLSNETLLDNLDKIVESANGLSATMDIFTELFKNESLSIAFELSPWIKKACELTSSKYKFMDIEIKYDLDDITLVSSKIELLQVFINILNFLRDKFKDEKNKIVLISSRLINGRVEVSFQDNSGEINERDLENIFDLNFSSDENDAFIGSKLFMSKEITIKKLKGKIKVFNEEFEYENLLSTGINFILYLPLDNKHITKNI